MADHNSSAQNDAPETMDDNARDRGAELRVTPGLSQEQARNANEGNGPNAAGGADIPSTAEDYVPSRSNPHASNLPTANTPDPSRANPQNPNAA
jgi:hypothetical protein